MRITNIIFSPGLLLFRLEYKFTHLSLQLVQIMRTINIMLLSLHIQKLQLVQSMWIIIIIFCPRLPLRQVRK
jgi:hypothetical protein